MYKQKESGEEYLKKNSSSAQRVISTKRGGGRVGKTLCPTVRTGGIRSRGRRVCRILEGVTTGKKEEMGVALLIELLHERPDGGSGVKVGKPGSKEWKKRVD